ncbi:MAG TPA: LCP family protein [Jiangellaceae bacterium]
MDDPTPRTGSRRARLQSRRQRRETKVGRFFTLAALGTLIPGLGLLAAGRRGWGKFILTLVGLGFVAAVTVLIVVPRDQLATRAFDRSQLGIVAVGLAALAVAWLVVAVSSLKALDTGRLPAGKRLAGALIVTALASVVVAPMAVGARNAWTQSNLIDTISQGSATAPDLKEEDPWEDKPRVNVLLLGGDAGEGRDGLRTDTVILASIDTETGDTTMISLPRNLERVPFATGTPTGDALAAQFPSGFTDNTPGNLEFVLFSVYRNAPGYVSPEVFAGSDDPGADAVKLAVAGALGVDVDYYVIADLAGFADIVDAIGGITIDVNYPIPIGTKKLEGAGAGCSQARDWIEPGVDKTLKGNEALWFARARCSPGHPTFDYASVGGSDPIKDDYNRMERQRCVMGAIAQAAEPMAMLTKFQSLAAATEKNIKTDIPAGMFPAFAELGLKVKNAKITSLTINRDVVNPGDPDYDHLRQVVDGALTPAPDVDESVEASTAAGTSDTSEEPDEPQEPDDAADPAGDDGDTSTDPGSDPTESPDPEKPVDVTKAC